MPKRTKDERLQRGASARILLDNAAFKQALADVRERIKDSLFRTSIDEQDQRERLFMQAKALDLIEGELQRAVKDESLERYRIKQAAEVVERIVPIDL